MKQLDCTLGGWEEGREEELIKWIELPPAQHIFRISGPIHHRNPKQIQQMCHQGDPSRLATTSPTPALNPAVLTPPMPTEWPYSIVFCSPDSIMRRAQVDCVPAWWGWVSMGVIYGVGGIIRTPHKRNINPPNLSVINDSNSDMKSLISWNHWWNWRFADFITLKSFHNWMLLALYLIYTRVFFLYVCIFVCHLWLAKPLCRLRSSFQGLLTKGQGSVLS